MRATSWTGSERQRRPQLPVACPDGFHGDTRYVSRAEVVRVMHGATVVPFGRHKGRTVADIARSDPNYLLWVLHEVRGFPRFRDAVRQYLDAESRP